MGPALPFPDSTTKKIYFAHFSYGAKEVLFGEMSGSGSGIGAGAGASGGDEEGEAIQVFVRIRPLNKREIAENQTIGWNFNETSMIEDTPNGHKNYTFDRCFGPEENNSAVYERVGKNVVIKALEGYNGTVFTCNRRPGLPLTLLTLSSHSD